MLTDTEAQLVADAYLLRRCDEQPGQELWFAAQDWLLPECHRLTFEYGYLHRRWHGDDLVYRLTDQALTAQELHALTQSVQGRQN